MEEDFSTRLKDVAKNKYGGVGKLAALIGITPTELSNYTSNQRGPGAKILTKLALAGIDVNSLLTGKESMEDRISHLEEKFTLLETENEKFKSQIYDLEKEIKNKNEQLIEKDNLIKSLYEQINQQKIELSNNSTIKYSKTVQSMRNAIFHGSEYERYPDKSELNKFQTDYFQMINKLISNNITVEKLDILLQIANLSHNLIDNTTSNEQEESDSEKTKGLSPST